MQQPGPMWRPLALVLVCAGCTSNLRPFPLAEPMWRDLDRRPYQPRPELPRFAHHWAHVDEMFLQPVSQFFAVTPGGEAVDVNALDEVPSSSWFENRLGRNDMTPEAVARGPCREPPLDPAGPWTIASGKSAGAYPGFVIEDAAGRKYMLKFDGTLQGPRASASEIVTSRLYHAVGFNVPCYEVVSFDREVLRIAPGADTDVGFGEKGPFTQRHLDEALTKAVRSENGRYRGIASRWLPGKPLGPWRYDGTVDGDLNDVVPHEDRRELRASRLLAAWTNNFDQKVGNTLATWIETGGGRGYVHHAIIDFGAALGSLEGRGPLSRLRRRGSSYYFDAGQIAVDFATLGIVTRPWDELSSSRPSPVFGFFDVEHFDPEGWRPPYPNPAFRRMTARDGAWMARILARFEDDHITAVVALAELAEPLASQLSRVLRGRRDSILDAYLWRVSPLTEPRVEVREGRAELCLTDLAARRRPPGEPRAERARVWVSLPPRRAGAPTVRRVGRDGLCVDLADLEDDYAVADVFTEIGERRPPPARVHLVRSARGLRVVGLERPYDHDPIE